MPVKIIKRKCWVCARGEDRAASASPGVMIGVCLGLELGKSCNNEFDGLFSAQNLCPMIPGDAIKVTISPRPCPCTFITFNK